MRFCQKMVRLSLHSPFGIHLFFLILNPRNHWRWPNLFLQEENWIFHLVNFLQFCPIFTLVWSGLVLFAYGECRRNLFSESLLQGRQICSTNFHPHHHHPPPQKHLLVNFLHLHFIYWLFGLWPELVQTEKNPGFFVPVLGKLSPMTSPKKALVS